MRSNGYPKLFIRSKNELAKHLSHPGFTPKQALELINDVVANFDDYWKDNPKLSEPEKEKYVRSAKGTPLGRLLKKINQRVLSPHDNLLPNFVFGGVSGLDHAKAAAYLLGSRRKRTLLKGDISRFFEQVAEDRVVALLCKKCNCRSDVARLLAKLCCVPVGPKGSSYQRSTIARGFATSSRLAVWCNLNIFLELDYLVKRRLRNRDPRMAIYVDDIGITASRVSKEELEKLYTEMEKVLSETDRNQKLPLHLAKKKIVSHMNTPQFLGLKLGRNRLMLGNKAQSKQSWIKDRLKKDKLSPKERSGLRRRQKGYFNYKRYIEKVSP